MGINNLQLEKLHMPIETLDMLLETLRRELVIVARRLGGIIIELGKQTGEWAVVLFHLIMQTGNWEGLFCY